MKITADKLTIEIQLYAETSYCQDLNIMYTPKKMKQTVDPNVDMVYKTYSNRNNDKLKIMQTINKAKTDPASKSIDKQWRYKCTET